MSLIYTPNTSHTTNNYLGNRRNTRPTYVQFTNSARQTSSVRSKLLTLVLSLLVAFLAFEGLTHPAFALDTDDPQPTAQNDVQDNTANSDNPEDTTEEAALDATVANSEPSPEVPEPSDQSASAAPEITPSAPLLPIASSITTVVQPDTDTDTVSASATKAAETAAPTQSAEPTPVTLSADTAEATATYVYISCPIEIYRGTANSYEPVEYLVDDFEKLPEHWLYVLTPLAEGENYIFTLDLACRTENSRFEGKINAIYSSYVPDDGSLGSVRIEATEEIAPDTFLVYYGEIKYISDGTINLCQNSYGNVRDHHIFYFSLAAGSLPEGQNSHPISEQRLSRLSDSAVLANISITGDAERLSSVYVEDLLQTEYMYPYDKYGPTQASHSDGPAAAALLSAPPDYAQSAIAA